MTAPLPSFRSDRTAATRGTSAAPRGGAAAGSAASSEQQQLVAAQRQAFDFETAERAEIQREHEALEALLMAQLKNEDEVMKKWIALI